MEGVIMKKISLMFVMLMFVTVFSVAAEEKLSHYDAKNIETSEQAVTALKENSAKIKALLKSKELKISELEYIHEISYTLEAAIDKLIKEKYTSIERLEAIDEAIQAVHHASEKHKEARVRVWFLRLDSRIRNLKSQSLGHEKSDKNVYEIFIKNHMFTPSEIRVPADKKIKLIVHNQDPTPEEFESDDFRREKIIAGNSKATIFVGPLRPGRYHFFGEFNLDKANGYLIVE